jgi:two-component system chemotaxis sensor kinase CheA
VLECIELPEESRRGKASRGTINLRGEPLPYIRLRDWFDLTSTERPRRENVVVIEVDGVKAGLVVDTLEGARQTVIKPLGKRFEDLPAIAGSSILGNGRVALILDVRGLMREVIRVQSQYVGSERNISLAGHNPIREAFLNQ